MLDFLAVNSTSLVVQLRRAARDRPVVTPLLSHLQAIGPHPQDGPVDEVDWGFVLKGGRRPGSVRVAETS